MEISKARLKQIIMEEIQKFMVVDEGDNPAAKAAVEDAMTALERDDEEKTKTAPDPFARPVKSTSTEEIQSSEVEEDGK